MKSPLACEPLAESHAQELHDELLDHRLYHFIPERPPRSLQALQREYAEFAGGAPAGSGEVWMNWAIRDTASQRCVGTLQATRFADGRLWVGYKIVPTAWNRGFASAALTWLTRELAHRFPGQPLLAAVDSRHAASIRVLQKCGFTPLREEPAELHGRPTRDVVFQFPAPGHSAP